MVLVDLDGRKVDGAFNPSTDTPTHVRTYQAFDSVGGVVHTHSKFATAFAQAGKPVPCYGTTHADYFYGEIPITRKMTPEEITQAYELGTGNVIVERFGDLDPLKYPGVLVHNHGPFAWGPTGEKAAENAVAMELLAEMAYYTLQLTPEIPPIDQALLDKHFKRKHGKDAYYGQ
jgi:L-ribulose-5-phosphate 4-epimerase